MRIISGVLAVMFLIPAIAAAWTFIDVHRDAVGGFLALVLFVSAVAGVLFFGVEAIRGMRRPER